MNAIPRRRLNASGTDYLAIAAEVCSPATWGFGRSRCSIGGADVRAGTCAARWSSLVAARDVPACVYHAFDVTTEKLVSVKPAR